MENKIPYEDFAKLTLQVGKILTVSAHPKADKLYILKVDLAEPKERQIIAGLRPYYSPSDLLNKKAIFITNLAPKDIRGEQSNGMILAADSGDKVVFLTPESDVKIGSKIR
jgi:methionyl-tRNA synthetase